MKEITYTPKGKKDTNKVISILNAKKKKKINDSLLSLKDINCLKDKITNNYTLFGNTEYVLGCIIEFDHDINIKKEKFFTLYRDKKIKYDGNTTIEITKEDSVRDSTISISNYEQFTFGGYFSDISLDFIKGKAEHTCMFAGGTIVEEYKNNIILRKDYDIVDDDNTFNIFNDKKAIYSCLILFPHTNSIPLLKIYPFDSDDIEIIDIMDIYEKETVEFNSIYCSFNVEETETRKIRSNENIKAMTVEQKVDSLLKYLSHEKASIDDIGNVTSFCNDLGIKSHEVVTETKNESVIYLNSNIIFGQKIMYHEDGNVSKTILYNNMVVDHDNEKQYLYTEGKEIDHLPDKIAHIHHNIIGKIIKAKNPCKFEFYCIDNNHYVIKYRSTDDASYSAKADIYNDGIVLWQSSTTPFGSSSKTLILDIDGNILIKMDTEFTSFDEYVTVHHSYTDANNLCFIKEVELDNKKNIISKMDYSAPELTFRYHIAEDGYIIVDEFKSSIFSLVDKYIYVRDEFGIPRRFDLC